MSAAPEPTSRVWWWVGALAAGGLAVRVANVLWWRPLDQTCTSLDRCFAINGDALYSHLQGELFAQGHGFASSFAYWLFGEIQPGAGDPPLYVLYLGLVSALHGSGGATARLLALLVLGLVVGLTWVTVRHLAGPRAGRVALALAGLAAALLLAVSVVPGWGGSAGVSRPPGGSGDATLTLPGGEETLVAARLDLDAVTAHRLASALAGTAGVVLLALVARRLGGDRAAILAAGIGAIYPLLWINDAMVLSESLYVPLVALVMLAAYRFWDRPGLPEAAVLGVTVALAGLTRAEALLLGPLVLVPLLWGRRDRLGWPAILARLGVGAGAAAVLVLPWLGYNLARFEEPTLMTAGTGAVLSAGSCDVAYDGEFVGYYGANCFQQYVDMGWTAWPDPRAEESVRDVPSREAAVRYIREHARSWPRVAAFRVARMWHLYKPTQDVRLDYQVEGRGRTASRAGFVVYVVLVPAALLGLVVLRRRRLPLSPLVAPALVVSLTAALTFGVTRYRVPADAALVVAAAVGLAALLRRWSPGTRDGTIVDRPGTGRESAAHA